MFFKSRSSKQNAVKENKTTENGTKFLHRPKNVDDSWKSIDSSILKAYLCS